ncbi:hypothetical protein [Microbacterium sp. NIBRBAC000506063]|uniref:hypothetical protein n=1 Tax=Microbacterium sp. NIBRBAC000506063 TaxID=2734618 RepID=UPI001CB6FE99|nr:hypothetical protein [Microbacterium sp. NIBRBAC000506063]
MSIDGASPVGRRSAAPRADWSAASAPSSAISARSFSRTDSARASSREAASSMMSSRRRSSPWTSHRANSSSARSLPRAPIASSGVRSAATA